MINIGAIGSLLSGGAAVGSSIFGALSKGGGDSGSKGGNKEMWWAMSATSDAVQRALQGYQDHLDGAQTHLMPYYQAGGQGLSALTNALTPSGGMSQTDMVSGLPPGAGADLTNFLTETPFYQGAMREALKGVENSLIARGGGLSGQGSKALTNFLGNYYLTNALAPAQQNYQAYLKNIAGLTGIGQDAAKTLGGYQMQTGQLKGMANLTQAQLQNALAGGMSTANVASDRNALLEQAVTGDSSGIGSILGTVAGLDWSKIGNALKNLVPSGAQNIGSSYGNATYGFGGSVPY